MPLDTGLLPKAQDPWLYQQTLDANRQAILTQDITNKINQAKLRHDVEESNWLKNLVGAEGAPTVPALNSLTNLRTEQLNQSMLPYKQDQSRTESLLNLARANSLAAATAAGGLPGVSDRQKRVEMERSQNPGGTMGKTDEQVWSDILTKEATSKDQALIKSRVVTYESGLGKQGMYTLGSQALIDPQHLKQGGFAGLIGTEVLTHAINSAAKSMGLWDYKNNRIDAGKRQLIQTEIPNLNRLEGQAFKFKFGLENFEQFVERQIPEIMAIARKTFEKVPPDDPRWRRAVALWWKGDVLGDPDIQEFETRVAPLIFDAVKVASLSPSGASGIGALADRERFIKMFFSLKNPEQAIYSTMHSMLKDMHYRQDVTNRQIHDIRQNIYNRGKGSINVDDLLYGYNSMTPLPPQNDMPQPSKTSDLYNDNQDLFKLGDAYGLKPSDWGE